MPEIFLNYRVYGPYVSNIDGRSRVILYDENRQRQTMSYPKFLWWKHKGILISDSQQIHHKDDDYTNNSIDNFEVVHHKEHMSLHVKPDAFVRTTRQFQCPSCDKSFEKNIRDVRNNQLSKNKVGPFCSRECAGRYGAHKQFMMGRNRGGGRRPYKWKKLAEKLYEIRKNRINP